MVHNKRLTLPHILRRLSQEWLPELEVAGSSNIVVNDKIDLTPELPSEADFVNWFSLPSCLSTHQFMFIEHLLSQGCLQDEPKLLGQLSPICKSHLVGIPAPTPSLGAHCNLIAGLYSEPHRKS